MKIEEENFNIKKELYDMEVRLLKALSENKTYLIQKIKNFKAILAASHGNYYFFVFISVFVSL